MASQAEIQQRNMESSILFMQQEHSHTLKGLHAEIQKLQKKCSELTFQLAMQTTSTSDEEVFRKRSEQLEATLAEKDSTIASFEETLEKKNKKVLMVEQQLRAQEKKFMDDLKLKDKIVRDLSEQLDAKSNHIATLTTQLLSLKKQYVAAIEIQQKTPAPPSAPQRGSGRRRPRVVDPPSSDRRVPSGRRLPATPGSTDLMPDPAPFLHSHDTDTDPHVDIKPGHVPLPPIQSNLEDGGIPLSKSFVRSRLQLRKKEKGAASVSQDVSLLAVDQVTDQVWRQPHESKSTDCT